MNELFSGLPLHVGNAASMSTVIFQAEFKVTRHLSKKNSNRIRYRGGKHCGTRRSYIGLSNDALALENELILNFREAAVHYGLTSPIDRRIWMLARFHYRRNKSGKECEAVADLSNLIQGPEDALQKAGVIKDDKLIKSLDGCRIVPDSDSNSLQIFILEF